MPDIVIDSPKPPPSVSPTIHEAMVTRHRKDGIDDPVLNAMISPAKSARVIANRANEITVKCFRNTTQTLPQRHRAARDVNHELQLKVTRQIGSALSTCAAELEQLQSVLAGPPLPKSEAVERRQAEVRDRLMKLPLEERRKLIDQAIAENDDLVINSVLSISGKASLRLLCDLGDADVALMKSNWARRNFPNEVDRLDRLTKAYNDLRQIGVLFEAHIGSLTDPKVIAAAEAADRAAREAIAAARQPVDDAA